MNTPKAPAPLPIAFGPLSGKPPAAGAAHAARVPLAPLVETCTWKGHEVDAYTLDRGTSHGFILANLYMDGELLFSRRVPYLPGASAEQVSALMHHHHDALLADLASGALDADLQAVLGSAAPSRGAAPAVVLPPPTPDPLPTRSFTYVYRGPPRSDEIPDPAPGPAHATRRAPAPTPPTAPAPATAVPAHAAHPPEAPPVVPARRGRAVPLDLEPAPVPAPAVVPPPPPPPPVPTAPAPRLEDHGLAPHLRVLLHKPADLLPMLFSTSSGLGLRVRGNTPEPLGAFVDVALWFLGRPLRQFLVRGMLAARRPATGGDPADELAITVPTSERTALDLAIEFARGILDPALDRASPRIRCELPARVVTAQGQEMPAVVMNISEGGAMLGRMPPLMDGTRLTLHLDLQGEAPLALPAEVRWFRTDGMPLVGIQFMHGGGSHERVEYLVKKMMSAAGGA